MKNTMTTTTTAATTTFFHTLAQIPVMGFDTYGITPAPAISPAIARAEKLARARGWTDDACAWYHIGAVYRAYAVDTMARVYMRHVHSAYTAYVDTHSSAYAVGDTGDFVRATGAISCTSGGRDRLGRVESRLTVSESRARRWARAQVERGTVDIATARLLFPDMDAGKVREHAVARALGVFDHVPDSADFFRGSDIVDTTGRTISVKSGSGATVCTCSGLWGACIARADTVGALDLLRGGLIPVRHTTGRVLHFPRLDSVSMDAYLSDIARIWRAFGVDARGDFLHCTSIRVCTGAATVHIYFD